MKILKNSKLFYIIIFFLIISPLLSTTYIQKYLKLSNLIQTEQFDRAIFEAKKIINENKSYYLAYEILVQAYSGKNNLEKSIEYFRNLIRKDPSNFFAYYGIGLAYKEINDFPKALESFKKCIEAGVQFSEVYREIAYCYQEKTELIKIINYLKELLKKNIKNPFLYFGLGYCYQNLGEYGKAKKFLFKALSIFKATSNLKEEGRCLRQLGRVYWFFSEFEKALKYFEKSLQISREINDLKEEGLCLNSIAVIHYYLGNYESSIIYYKKALKIAREIGDKRNEAECLNNIRYCYTIYGDYIRALEYSEQALNLAQQMKDKFIELRCLISLGELYRYLGYKLKALNYYFRGLKIAQKIGDKAQEKIIWNNIGHIYLNDKEYKKALKYLEKGLEISNQIGDIRTKMALIHNIGYIYWKLNDYSRALKNALYSLKISQNIKDKYMEGKNLNFLGEIFLNIKNYSKSINYFTKAFNIGQKIKHSELLLESLMGIARFYETKGQFYQALEYYKKAIREIENVRAKLLLSEYKYGFLKSKIEVYNNLINLLGIMHSKFPFKGYDRESFYFSEKARARALLDSLQEAKIDLNKSLSSDFKNQIEEINRKISNIMTELENFEIPEEKRKKLLKELDIAEENYERLMRKVKLQNLRYTNIIYPKTLSSSQIQKALSEKNFNKTLILEYMLDKNEIILWAISSINFSMYLIPKEKDFEKLIINYYNLLAEKDTSLNKVQLYGERLFKILLSPVKEELKKYSNLIIIPDGVLYFLPFETLILQTEKEKKYLIKTHNITYSPSSTVLIHLISKQKIKEQKRKYQLLLVGDPVFPTFPLKSASNKLYQPLFGPFERIPYTDDEIFGISRYFPKRKKVILEENSFTEEMLKSLDLRKFKIIHFATHTLIDEIIPWRSAIIFSLDNNPKEDGFLQLREVYNLKLNADLVVLSGCKTNLGKYIAGEGLVSLTRGFLYAGSSSVMGSLWEVGDLSTAYFMKLFYFYLKKGRRKNEALRKAKLEMMKYLTYKHPYHWAGLILIGEFNKRIFTNYFQYFFLLILIIIVSVVIYTLANIFLKSRSK